jgi:hypothetical protein
LLLGNQIYSLRNKHIPQAFNFKARTCIVVKEFGKYSGDKNPDETNFKKRLDVRENKLCEKSQFEDNFQFLPKKSQEVVP